MLQTSSKHDYRTERQGSEVSYSRPHAIYTITEQKTNTVKHTSPDLMAVAMHNCRPKTCNGILVMLQT